MRVLPSLGDERWGGCRGNNRPEEGPLFPQKMTPLFELKRPAIRDAPTLVEHPDFTSKDLGNQRERADLRHDLNVHARPWP